jgi:thioredoxin reductase (NADPH)
MTSETFDIAVLGAGPVGLFGCFYAGMRGMRTILIDSLPEPGGQLAALYPEKYVYDMPGFPKVLARDLAREMTEQGLRFSPHTVFGHGVDTLVHEKDTWLLGSNTGTYAAKTVVICAGAGAFTPKRLDAPGVQEFEGRGVHYFVTDRSLFAEKRLLLVGGGDSALDWAMNLEPIAGSVTLVHRSDRFRAHEESVDWLLHRSKVDVRIFTEIAGVSGGDSVEAVQLQNTRTGAREELSVDCILINIGFHADVGPIRSWGLVMDGPHIVVDRNQKTNLPGVFAAGDICTYDGKLKLIATGVGEVCTAVNFAKMYVDPSARLFPGHSSNMEF